MLKTRIMNSKLPHRLLHFFCALLLSVYLCMMPMHTVRAGDLNVSATLDGGSCTLKLQDAQIHLGDQGKVDPKNAINKSWVFLGEKNLVLIQTCSKLHAGKPQPVIKIVPFSGTRQVGTVPGLYAMSGTSKGFGVVVGSRTRTAKADSLDKSHLINQENQTIEVEDNGGAAAYSYSIPVAVACGDTADCKFDKLGAGDLKAVFRIEFEYK
ncbi:hypothetical protein L9F34_001989 [Klebsiella aerogenes]|nr:hypothetical protein [Klebsiella aerogenes]